ncbi:hypothetical protein BDZ45DRAFT_697693 [Acephala macrosclerotiorum]|nr:hypothetical protein BDZ45DRAFT_697693 [Acephala macrosclerotiorum]
MAIASHLLLSTQSAFLAGSGSGRQNNMRVSTARNQKPVDAVRCHKVVARVTVMALNCLATGCVYHGAGDSKWISVRKTTQPGNSQPKHDNEQRSFAQLLEIINSFIQQGRKHRTGCTWGRADGGVVLSGFRD